MNALALSAGNGRDEIIRHLLVQGGDERITLDPATGRNRYGCGPAPDDALAFGSSTASTISASAFASLAPCAERLLDYPSPSRAYAVEAEMVRRRLARLCGLPVQTAANIVLAPSGTDLHLIVADLETALTVPNPSYDLILAADTLVYLGDLAAVFQGAAAKLKPDGYFLFTTEAAAEGFELGPKRRWRHSDAYLRATAQAAGLNVAGLVAAAPRREANVPVDGFAVALSL